MSSKPKAPKPTAQELELQREQRDQLNDLTRDRNASLKALKRNLGGRRGLLGSGSERGVGAGGVGSRGGGGGGSGGSGGAGGGRGGGILTSGAAAARSSTRVPGYRTPNRSTSQ